MRLLEERILKDGRILPGEILKVDNFLNHQIDPELFMAMGQDFAEYFKDRGINKILTLEVSGIAVAFAVGHFLKVPVLFAKKSDSLTLTSDVYAAKVESYTKKKVYDIRVQKNFLTMEDNILIIDDFLAMGEALKGLISLCNQAQAEIKGVGIAIEKTFQPGGNYFRGLGYDVYSQARIARFEDGSVVFVQEDE